MYLKNIIFYLLIITFCVGGVVQAMPHGSDKGKKGMHEKGKGFKKKKRKKKFKGPKPELHILSFEEEVAPDVIFGSGNANGSFTVGRGNNVEVGLRAKLRFDENNQPKNIFNSDMNGTYFFPVGQPPGGGFGFAPNSPSTAIWNFEWSVNVNLDGESDSTLSDFFYDIHIDFDPSEETHFLSFDPIRVPFADHSLGDNSTGNGQGVEATDELEYAMLLDYMNVAQNSWNYEFFDDPPAFPFNANVVGEYDIVFAVRKYPKGPVLSHSEIKVVVTPEPSTYLLLGSCLFIVAILRNRRYNQGEKRA